MTQPNQPHHKGEMLVSAPGQDAQDREWERMRDPSGIGDITAAPRNMRADGSAVVQITTQQTIDELPSVNEQG